MKQIIIFLLLIISLCSCMPNFGPEGGKLWIWEDGEKTPKRTEFICIADVNKDSKCRFVPCSDIKNIAKTGNYRIMKNYVSGYAYLYSVDPPTDMDVCLKNVYLK